MPISEQEGAGEFVSIKQIWLCQINRCNESLSNFPLKCNEENRSGVTAAITSVGVLIINLIDFGDAPIKSEYNIWWRENRIRFKDRDKLDIARIKLEKIIDILNKYQMLHDSLPRGYSNVILEGVKEDDIVEQ